MKSILCLILLIQFGLYKGQNQNENAMDLPEMMKLLEEKLLQIQAKQIENVELKMEMKIRENMNKVRIIFCNNMSIYSVLIQFNYSLYFK